MRFHLLVALLVLFALVTVEAKRGRKGEDGVSRKPRQHKHKKPVENAVEEGRAKRSAEFDENLVDTFYEDMDALMRDKRDAAPEEAEEAKEEKKDKKEGKDGKHKHHQHKGKKFDAKQIEEFRAKFAGRTRDPKKVEEFRAKFAGRTFDPKKVAEFRAKFTGKFHNRRATTASP